VRALLIGLLFAALTLGLSKCSLTSSNQGAFALTSAGHIIAFNTGDPTKIKGEVAVSGLNTNESLLSLTQVNGSYYGVTSAERLVLVNPNTGATTALGSGFGSGTLGSAAVDVDPNTTALRLISGNQNLQIETSSGSLVSTDTSPFYVPNDQNYISPPGFRTSNIVAIAYTRSGSPTLFGFDSNTQSLVRIGGNGGSPSAASGQLFTVGQPDVTFGPNAAFYIGSNGIAWAVLAPNGAGARLYNVDLSTGAVTLVNRIGDGTRTIVALVVNS
jgi:hypothetical protein